jgi:hypothetical protein
MTPSAAPRQMRVVLAGELGPALAAAFAPLVAHVADGRTVLEGTTDVEAVVTRIGELGLRLLAMETEPPAEDPAPAP